MSAEFDDMITSIYTIKSNIDDAAAFSIAERCALDLLLESLKNQNQRLLLVGERGAGRVGSRR